MLANRGADTIDGDANRPNLLIEEARRITADEITSGGLADLDVLVFPGGSGSRQVNDLGAMGVAKVREFIRTAGKGAVGLCAGAVHDLMG